MDRWLPSHYLSHPLSDACCIAFASALHRNSQFRQSLRVARNGMPLSVIKEDGRVLITHAKKGHGAVDVWIVASNNVTCRHINNVLALIGEEASD